MVYTFIPSSVRVRKDRFQNITEFLERCIPRIHLKIYLVSKILFLHLAIENTLKFLVNF